VDVIDPLFADVPVNNTYGDEIDLDFLPFSSTFCSIQPFQPLLDPIQSNPQKNTRSEYRIECFYCDLPHTDEAPEALPFPLALYKKSRISAVLRKCGLQVLLGGD
jgi:hypothetical protein